MSGSGSLRYLFPPPERKQMLGPLGAGQLAAVGTVAMITVFGVVRANPTPAGMLLGAALVGLVAVVAITPVRGRVLTEWAPLSLRHGLARLRGDSDYRARVPLHGRPEERLRLPAELGDLEVVAHPWQAGTLGVMVDRAAGSYCAALEVGGPQFLLETTSRQEELLGGWGRVLARLATAGEVRRLQWIHRIVPDDAAAIVEDLKASQAPDVATAAELARSYLAALATAASGASRHQTLVVAQLGAQRSARAIRQAGGGDQGACAVLAASLDAVASDLAELGVDVASPLDPLTYRGAIRTAFDPAARVELDTLARLDAERGWGSDWPWPLATEERWGYYRTADRAWHRSFTLTLPLGEVPADWAAPMMLGDAPVCRTLGVTVQPVSHRQASREATRTLTRLLAEDERKQRLGQVRTAHDAKQESAALARMQELADGHADVLYAVTVTVTAPDLEALDQACQSVDHVAGMASCELRQLESQQAQAFTWTLPLARGLD